MLRFNLGDKVILARPSKTHEWWGIDPKTSKGLEYEIIWKTRQDQGRNSDYEIEGNGFNYVVMDDMLDYAVPLSPFEQSVRAYIDQELSDG